MTAQSEMSRPRSVLAPLWLFVGKIKETGVALSGAISPYPVPKATSWPGWYFQIPDRRFFRIATN